MHASVFGRNVTWTPGLEHYLRDVTRVGPDGRIEVIPSERVLDAIFRSRLAARIRAFLLAGS